MHAKKEKKKGSEKEELGVIEYKTRFKVSSFLGGPFSEASLLQLIR